MDEHVGPKSTLYCNHAGRADLELRMSLSVTQATELVLGDARSFGTREVDLHAAAGRALAENLVADRPFPPFDRVMMDGVALSASVFESGQRAFPIERFQYAGAPAGSLQDAKACIEVATGAVLPAGCDAVVMYEELHMEDGIAQLQCENVRPGQNIHFSGADRKLGACIVPRGTVCTGAEIGVAATVGKTSLLVRKHPRTVIVSTGDELVTAHETPEPHQIRRSNVYALQSLLGVAADQMHLPDDREEVKRFFERAISNYDLVVLCGAVSKGKRDYIPDVLMELKAFMAFHGVDQRPGKHMWFGRLNEATVFGLPGNPVSTFACGLRYVRIWIDACQGITRPGEIATLASDVAFRPNLAYFLPVRVKFGRAFPVPGHGSGDLANLAEADGFLELPADREQFNVGESFPYFSYR